MGVHNLNENIKENDATVDTHHLKLSNNHGDFIHEFVFSKYLTWLQNTTDTKLHTLFGFIKDNRKNINIVDDEHHQLQDAFNKLEERVNNIKIDNVDLSNYYNKISIDTLLNHKVNLEDYNQYKIDNLISLNQKADKNTVYTKSEIDSELEKYAKYTDIFQSKQANHDDLNDFEEGIYRVDNRGLKNAPTPTLCWYNVFTFRYGQDRLQLVVENVGGVSAIYLRHKSDNPSIWHEWQNLRDTYTKSEIDELLENNSVDLSNYYTKEQVQNMISILKDNFNEQLNDLRKKVNALVAVVFGADTVDWDDVVAPESQVYEKIKNVDQTLSNFIQNNADEFKKTYDKDIAMNNTNTNLNNNSAILRVLMLHDMQNSKKSESEVEE